jgi:iron complex outermembrane recepter protein
MWQRVCTALAVVLVVNAGAALAAGLAGKVVDAESGAPIAGAEVRVTGAPRTTLSGIDGRFLLADVPAGEVSVAFFRTGYQPAKRTLTAAEVAAADTSAAGTWVMPLTPVEFRAEPIVVSAARAERGTSPVPHANLSRRDLEERYAAQDLPVLLSELPSSVYSSESGNGIGYSSLTLRGFEQRRLTVLVNGVPQNDPEDQDVYWIDFPDLAANLQDVQVQRGAGSAFYGPPAIGGAVNLVTSVFKPQPGVQVSVGGGSFGTRRYSVELNSGLVNSTYGFYGRWSHLLSDGYRHDAWVDLTAYFFGAARYDEHATTRLHVYGGPVQDGLSYYGVPQVALGDRNARRQNPLAGGAQIENFSQPHYELLHEWRPSATVKLFNTFFYVQGTGFYDYDTSWADSTYFRLTHDYGFSPTANPGTSLVRANVDNHQGGWLPRIEWTHARGEFTAGAELRLHRSEHWGKIRWAQALPATLDPERMYYRYRGAKEIASLYAQEKWRLRPALHATASLQLSYNRYRFYDEKYVGTDFAVPYFFVNPRAGLNYNWTKSTTFYASYGYTQREPRLKNLYDAAESSGGATPQFERVPGGGLDFGSPLVHPEKLHDYELGGTWHGARTSLDLNLFWMNFHDEIVKNGQLDRFGEPITGNAPRSVHRGAELAVRVLPWQPLELAGNVSWSRNRFVDFRVYEDENGDPAPGGIQLDGNRIAGFPDFVANLRGTCRAHGAYASLAGRYVGGFHTTNFQEVDRQVPPYFALDAELAWGLAGWSGQRTRLRLQVRNVLDRLYVLNGEGDEFFPAATRSVFAGVDFGF